jgi:large subunit ribosomal protein L29
MKAAELKDKSIEELEQTLLDLTKDHFSFRMEKSTGQLNQPHLVKELKRDIARVKTVLNQKAKESSE